MRRGAGRHGAGADLILELAEMARCALAAFEGGEQALLEDLAHPGDRLLGAARTKRAGLGKRGDNARLILVHSSSSPRLFARRKRQHLRLPVRMASGENMQASAVFDCRSFGALDIVAVGLVDGDDVGELEQAALDALQLVAGARGLPPRRKRRPYWRRRSRTGRRRPSRPAPRRSRLPRPERSSRAWSWSRRPGCRRQERGG